MDILFANYNSKRPIFIFTTRLNEAVIVQMYIIENESLTERLSVAQEDYTINGIGH